MKTIKREFHREQIPVDFHEYDLCTFIECTIIYYGHTPPAFTNCSWSNCSFTLRGPAALGMEFVGLMKNSGNPGMVDMANKLLRAANLPTE